jgi:hypothetical protein
MTRREAQQLVRVLRRQFLLSSLTTGLLLCVVVFSSLGAVLGSPRTQAAWIAATFAGVAWILLAALSPRQVKAANNAAAFLSAGRLDLAEQELTNALGLFSLYRTGKLLVCHNLAVVMHGQKNYQAAAELCDGIISLHHGVSKSLGRVCRMLLADSRLFLGDTLAALSALAPLLRGRAGLSLAEQLMLLPIELRCLVAQNDFIQAADNLAWKVQRAELLDAPRAALVHALLAKACRQTGNGAAADFLARRAELYHDLGELRSDYPILKD